MKLYPFSIQKNAHSVEYYYNHVKNTMYDMESGEIPMDSARYDRLSNFLESKLLPLYTAMFNSRDGKVTYLTGEQIALAKKIVAWASEQRANHLIENGKREFLQYCQLYSPLYAGHIFCINFFHIIINKILAKNIHVKILYKYSI